MSNWYVVPNNEDLMHYGTKGMKWRNRKGQKHELKPFGVTRGAVGTNVHAYGKNAGASVGTTAGRNQQRLERTSNRNGSNLGAGVSVGNGHVSNNIARQMVSGFRSVNVGYLYNNWKNLDNKTRIAVVNYLKKKNPTAYSQLVRRTNSTSSGRTNSANSRRTHSGGSGGRY